MVHWFAMLLRRLLTTLYRRLLHRSVEEQHLSGEASDAVGDSSCSGRPRGSSWKIVEGLAERGTGDLGSLHRRVELEASDGRSGHSGEGQAALMQLRQRPKPGNCAVQLLQPLRILPSAVSAKRRKTIRLPGFFSPFGVCQLHLLRGKGRS